MIVRVFGAVLLLASLIGLTGCSGIHASKAISPATFLLPGLMQTEPAPVDPNQTVPVSPSAGTFAQAN